MKLVRKLALVFLLVYFSFAVGAFFHSHPSGTHHATNCKLCQLSHTDLDQVQTARTADQEHDLGYVFLETTPISTDESSILLRDRAPPLV